MTKPRPIPDRLRALAAREGQRITHADSMLCDLAAALIEESEQSLQRVAADGAAAAREACFRGATISVVRDRMREVLHLMEHDV